MKEKKTTEIQNILVDIKKIMEEKNIESLSLFDYNLNQDIQINSDINYIEWGNSSYNQRQNILTIAISGDESLESIIEDLKQDLEEVKKIADKKAKEKVIKEVEQEINEINKKIENLNKDKEMLKEKYLYTNNKKGLN